jgi:hypothetical protein
VSNSLGLGQQATAFQNKITIVLKIWESFDLKKIGSHETTEIFCVLFWEFYTYCLLNPIEKRDM